jgi:DNA-binding beta-propeller fold protein YncE
LPCEPRYGQTILVRLLALLLAAGCGGETVVYGTQDPWSADPAPISLIGRIVVTNNGDDTLSVFDPAAGTVVGKVPVGFIPVELEGPHHVVADPGGLFVYLNLSEAVAGSGTGPHGAHGTGTQPGFTLKLASDTGRVAGQATVDPNPGDLTISADGATIYVTHYDLIKWTQGAESGDMRKGDANLAIIDAATMTIRTRVPLCPAAHGVRISGDGATLYSTCGPDEIAIVELGNLGVRRVPLPGLSEQPSCVRCPYAIGPHRSVE